MQTQTGTIVMGAKVKTMNQSEKVNKSRRAKAISKVQITLENSSETKHRENF